MTTRLADDDRARLAAIVQSSDDAIIGKTLDGTITDWNPAAERLYGYRADEVLGRSIALLFPPERQHELPRILQRLARGERIEHQQVERMRKDGTRVTVSVSVSPLHDAAGRVVGAAGIGREVTATARATARAARLGATAAALAGALTPEQVADAVLAQAIPALGACAAGIARLSDDQTELLLLGAVGFDPQILAGWRRRPLTRGSPGESAIRARAAVFAESPDAIARAFPGAAALLAIQGYRACASVPLLAHDRPIGALTLCFDAPHPFPPEERVLLDALGTLCAQALERARLFAAERAAAERARRLQEVTAALVSANTSDDVVSVMMAQGLAALGAFAGVVYLVADDAAHLEAVASVGHERRALADWTRLPLDSAGPLLDALRSSAPVYLETLEEYRTRYPHLAAAHHPDTRAMANVPLIAGGRTLGGLSLSFRESRTFPPQDQALISGLVGQCALALERVRLHERERQARANAEAGQRRLGFLAELSAALSASLDYEQTLRTVARLTVPALADWCVVDLLAEDGAVRRVATVHPDPARVRLAEELRERYPDPPDQPFGVPHVLRTGQAQLWPEISDADVARVARDPEHLALLRALGFTGAMIVPLAARSRVLGALALFSSSTRRFGQEDLTLAEEVGRRVGLAIAHARAFREAREAEAEARWLYEAALAIGGDLDPQARLERVLDAALSIFGVEQATVTLRDDATGEVAFVAGRGRIFLLRGHRMPLGEGLNGRVVAENRPLRSDDMLADPRTWDSSTARAEGLRSWLGVPLADARGAFGALAVMSDRPGAFTDEHQRRLTSLAALASASVMEARLREELQRAIRARDEFLSVAAHELRTPITSLRGYAGLHLRRLQRGPVRDLDTLRHGLEVIDQQAQRLNHLIEQLLDVSRIGMGQLRLERREVDLAALAADAVAAMRVRETGHAIRIAADGPAPAWVDPLRIEQVLTNLLDNALKYSPDGGDVLVQLSRPDTATVQLAVRDHGIGIPPDQRPRIFDRFFQAHWSADGYRSGMGLGLFITRQIVDLHGGSIEPEFPDDGGTRFVVSLPAAPDGPPPAAEPPGSSP